MIVTKRTALIGGFSLFLLTWFAALLKTGSVLAASAPPPEPDRYLSITIDYTSYKWQLLRWENSGLVCEINIEHEGLPTLSEVYVDCGEDLYTTWIEQDACPPIALREDISK